MKKLFLFYFLLLSSLVNAQQNLAKYVKPLIGTEKMGHTYPGATVPFGAVQLSPETDSIPYAVNHKYNPKVYDYCAGYRFEDKTITGFIYFNNQMITIFIWFYA